MKTVTAKDVVIAGVFPAKTYSDGSWDVSGNTPTARLINDYLLTTVLTTVHLVDKVTRGHVAPRIPVTPLKQSVLYRAMSALGVRV